MLTYLRNRIGLFVIRRRALLMLALVPLLMASSCDGDFDSFDGGGVAGIVESVISLVLAIIDVAS